MQRKSQKKNRNFAATCNLITGPKFTSFQFYAVSWLFCFWPFFWVTPHATCHGRKNVKSGFIYSPKKETIAHSKKRPQVLFYFLLFFIENFCLFFILQKALSSQAAASLPLPDFAFLVLFGNLCAKIALIVVDVVDVLCKFTRHTINTCTVRRFSATQFYFWHLFEIPFIFLQLLFRSISLAVYYCLLYVLHCLFILLLFSGSSIIFQHFMPPDRCSLPASLQQFLYAHTYFIRQ